MLSIYTFRLETCLQNEPIKASENNSYNQILQLGVKIYNKIFLLTHYKYYLNRCLFYIILSKTWF